jgi:CheY-like chemotaxis protein
MARHRRGAGALELVLVGGPIVSNAHPIAAARGAQGAQARTPRYAVLCVDDEPNVLEGLTLHLERSWNVVTASSGKLGLEKIAAEGPFAVVLSDMRMPEMDGAVFLSRVRQTSPDTVRMLLTGHADLDSAVAAINEGQIFRFLTKPCPPPLLIGAMKTAIEQYRLVTGERVLLEQTLHGSIKTLTDVLSLTHPVAFGRATRVRQHVATLAEKLGLAERWQVEVAAMLSQIGCVTLPPETVNKLHHGGELSEDEQRRVARLPEIVEQLIGNIPRLEVVREIVANQNRPTHTSSTGQASLAVTGAHLLRIATDYDMLESHGSDPARALDTMRGRNGAYDPKLLEAFAAVLGSATLREEIRELPLRSVEIGMVFAEDLQMANGTLLVARGYEVTAGFVERIENFRPGMVKEPARVVVRAAIENVRGPRAV